MKLRRLAACCLLALPLAAADSALTRKLSAFIEREMADKQIPAFSIALIDGGGVSFAAGFGYADPQQKKRATRDTVYRVGSVSKIFTDLAVMQMAERMEVDIDSPVSRYLREFQPRNPFPRAITLRQLMSHRSGLVREPPVGHYFDTASPSLAETVMSLNRTALVYEPETITKYSNAGVAVAGCAIEQEAGMPFARLIERRILRPMDLGSTSFTLKPALKSRLAKGQMWTYDGRTFEAPVFDFGMAPAGNLYSTVSDLARFFAVLLDGGWRIIKPETLQKMWTAQFKSERFGIGFALGELDGERTVGHGGAVYGFATDVVLVPGRRVGAVAVAAKDSANPVVSRITRQALRWMLALKTGKPLADVEATTAVPPPLAAQIAGRYGEIELTESGGVLYYTRLEGGPRLRLRMLGEALIADDTLGYGRRLERAGADLRDGKEILRRQPDEAPAPLRPEWRELIGEYGWDHNVLYILERAGKLTALIEWYDYYPLLELSGGEFRFPPWGLYESESLHFLRDSRGRVSGVSVAGVVFPRRRTEDSYAVRPPRPVPVLLREARAASPPRESGNLRKPELVDLASLDPAIRLDIRYASSDNFLGAPVYAEAKALLQRPAAEALLRAHRRLKERGFGLLIHDAYRPWYVTKVFWDATPPDKRHFVADPAKGSRHNRGCAVDLTLYDLKSAKPVEMPGIYDEMSERSYPDYRGGTDLQRWLRGLLRRAMEAEGFTVYEFEWWHFDYKDWQHYGIGNQ